MTAFVALLRAVNVGGTGKLPMSELKEMCEALGFAGVRTYIASGNVVFESRKSEAAVKKALEASLEDTERLGSRAERYFAIMDALSGQAYRKYRALIYDTPGFEAYFRASTPIAEIGERVMRSDLSRRLGLTR